jgi:hypothetical protein
MTTHHLEEGQTMISYVPGITLNAIQVVNTLGDNPNHLATIDCLDDIQWTRPADSLTWSLRKKSDNSVPAIIELIGDVDLCSRIQNYGASMVCVPLNLLRPRHIFLSDSWSSYIFKLRTIMLLACCTYGERRISRSIIDGDRSIKLTTISAEVRTLIHLFIICLTKHNKPNNVLKNCHNGKVLNDDTV